MPAKGHFTRLTCKYPGCNGDLHIYPNGTKASYCNEHLRFRKGHGRMGLGGLTGPMRVVLERLYAAYLNGQPEVKLGKETDYRTIRTLTLDRDWMIAVERPDGMYYVITKRGRDDLKGYEGNLHRLDGICPRCETRPRYIRESNKKRASYCRECEKLVDAEKRARGICRINPNRPCSLCRKRPLYQYPGGKYSTYCQHCARIVRRKNARKLRKQAFERYQRTGDLPLCQRCHSVPVVVHPNCLAKYCRECKRFMESQARTRRVLKKHGIYILSKHQPRRTDSAA